MTPTMLGIILSAALGGTGAVGLKYYLDRRAPEPNHVEHNLEQVIGDIIEEHVQRNSEDSDTDIDIHVHIHSKEK
ncbi:hypothetical protein UFOVP9_2 [uncultured Caudovirales phage]|jgi:hypothetical protein|uniref:Uncharacterized protein n=1 Tax=uncultured Caudovirales phage TaxID=2100421 RepID=A0A6J5KGI7_9CAUD|nr:hypothetical protein UFOVP9_2 [uncultured Caudovirales phage]